MRRSSDRLALVIAAGILMGIFLLFALAGGALHVMTKDEATITVDEKWIKQTSSDSQTYLISTDRGVMAIRDQLWEGFFRSADLYAKIRPGETYCVRYSGFRWGFISAYPRIYQADLGSCPVSN